MFIIRTVKHTLDIIMFTFDNCITKNDFRCLAKEKRNSLGICDVSEKLVSQIRNADFYRFAKTVMLYYPKGSEYNLLPLLEDNKKFIFPVVENDDIYPVFYDPNKGFKTGEFHIQEPIGEVVDDFSTIDLVVLPALCCNKFGYRLGYGKAFYDRFLAKLTNKTVTTIAIYSEFLVDDLPVESHDKRVDFIITEQKIYNCHLF